MGLLDELKRALGIDEVDAPPEAPGPTPERTARLRELGLEPLPGEEDPPAEPQRGFGQMLRDNLDRDRRELGMLTAKPEGPVQQPDPLPTTAYIDPGTGKQMWAPTRKVALDLIEKAKRVRGGGGAEKEPAVASAAARTDPTETGATDTGKAELLLAMKNASKPPEDQSEEPNPTPGQQIHPDPTSSTGADKPAVETGLRPPPTPPPAEHDAGGPLGSVSRMVMGAGGDPRTQRLREALERSGHMKRLAGHLTGMGIGADIARGDGYHRADQGKDLRDRADDEVNNEMLPTQYEQKNARFDTEQQRSAQDMRLRDSAEGRAQQGELRAEAGEQRAGAAELRQQKGFETQQGASDPKSQTSASARASVESLYPAAWKRIPEEIRNGFSAKDVERIFGELKPMGTGPSKQNGIDNRQARAMAAKAKLNDPQSVTAMNDILATLDAGSAPGTGYFMNQEGWQNFIRSPDGAQFRQAVLTIANKYIRDTAGQNVTGQELERTMGQLGYGTFDDPQSLASGIKRMAEGMESNQTQKLNQLPPEAKKLLEEQGAVEHIDPKRGRALKGNPETEYEDSFDPLVKYPKLKAAVGVLGMAKQWLGGKPGGRTPVRNWNLDRDD